MINKLDNNQIHEGTLNTNKDVLGATQNANDSSSSQINVKNSADNTEDASLQISFDSLIEQAKQAANQDDSAVARAKALIASRRTSDLASCLAARSSAVRAVWPLNLPIAFTASWRTAQKLSLRATLASTARTSSSLLNFANSCTARTRQTRYTSCRA